MFSVYFWAQRFTFLLEFLRRFARKFYDLLFGIEADMEGEISHSEANRQTERIAQD
jgi:hypothetical protein